MIWLCDLPKANARRDETGNIEILEDNSKGFFRISEKPENLKNNRVYIQVKSGQIYRISELFRRESSDDKKSTIRYFVPEEEYTEEAFIDAIKTNSIGKKQKRNNNRFNETTNSLPAKQEDCETPKTLRELWKTNYCSMVVMNINEDQKIYINHNGRGEMFRNQNGCVVYRYMRHTFQNKYNKHNDRMSEKEYLLRKSLENSSIWILIEAKML
jgi:hypothetical protein